MSRSKVTDEDRMKQFLAASDLLMLNKFRDLTDFAIMAKGGTTKPIRTPRKKKDAAQGALALKEST